MKKDYFKHMVDDSIRNPVLTGVEQEFGNVGYAVYYKLVELLVPSNYNLLISANLLRTRLKLKSERMWKIFKLMAKLSHHNWSFENETEGLIRIKYLKKGAK